MANSFVGTEVGETGEEGEEREPEGMLILGTDRKEGYHPPPPVEADGVRKPLLGSTLLFSQ